MTQKRVYFIKPINMVGPIKIGFSQSPDGRRDTLETWSPFPLEIIAEIEGGLDLEARFHTAFIGNALRREWFEATPRLLATIDEIVAGTFDVATLPQANTEIRRLMRRKPVLKERTPGERLVRSVVTRVNYIRRSMGPGLWSQLYRIVPDPIDTDQLKRLSATEVDAINPEVNAKIAQFKIDCLAASETVLPFRTQAPAEPAGKAAAA